MHYNSVLEIRAKQKALETFYLRLISIANINYQNSKGKPPLKMKVK
jgi:hypothetical protein